MIPAAAVLVAAASCAGPGDEGIADPLARARRWSSTIETYRFASGISLERAGRTVEVRVTGQVRDRGEGQTDLLASIRTDAGETELLRLGDRLWRRTADGPWRRAPELPEEARASGRRLSDLLEAVEATEVERTEGGWTVEGSAGARDVGIPGTGRVRVVLTLDGSARLVGLESETTVRMAGGGSPQPVRLRVRTGFSDFDAELPWPSPPSGTPGPAPTPEGDG